MLHFDRVGAKRRSKELLRTAKPSPLIVSLIFLVLTNGISLCVDELTVNPFQDATQYLMKGYDPMEVFAYTFTGMGPMIAIFLSILVTFYTSIMSYGYAGYALRMSRGEEGKVEHLLEGFGLAAKVVLLDILQAVLIFMWSMLFLIPGIIASWRYSQAVFCLLEDPEISPFEAIRRSCQLMRGHKLELFGVQVSFIGWIVLQMLVGSGMGFAVGSMLGQDHFLATAASYIFSGVVSLVVLPYMQFTFAQYYNYLTGWRSAESRDEYEIRF